MSEDIGLTLEAAFHVVMQDHVLRRYFWAQLGSFTARDLDALEVMLSHQYVSWSSDKDLAIQVIHELRKARKDAEKL